MADRDGLVEKMAEAMRIKGHEIWRKTQMAEQPTYEDLARAALAVVERERGEQPSPTFWPGEHDREEVGPIGDGTPHARMKWFWERMRAHEGLVEELTGWSPVSSKYRWEAAVADAFDKLVVEREREERHARELGCPYPDADCSCRSRVEPERPPLTEEAERVTQAVGAYLDATAENDKTPAERALRAEMRNALAALASTGPPLTEENPPDWDSEVCHRCGQHSVAGFGVPDDVWERVVEGRWNILCLRCFDILADPKDVAWEAACSLYATSTATARRARSFEALLASSTTTKDTPCRRGALVRPGACERCGQETEVHAHHDDYSKPLEVTWLCQPCHVAEHRELHDAA